MITADKPFTLLLFGASGHLAKTKIFPALYVLALKNRLPQDFAIVGYARTPMTDESFRAMVREAVVEDMKEVNDAALTNLVSHMHYMSGQYDSKKDFEALAHKLNGIEHGWGNHVRLCYLSVPPVAFDGIVKRVHALKLSEPGRLRCIVEKPVGTNLESFKKIKRSLLKQFGEEQVYLFDHYLGKEATRNVYYLRTANVVVQQLLKCSAISHVEISAPEIAGLKGRAGYFDTVGLLRDWLQSHLLVLASLLTMETGDEEGFAERRLAALKKFQLPAGLMSEAIVQGQYGQGTIGNEHAIAYKAEDGIAEGSRTNTYFALRMQNTHKTWRNIPFFFEAGKRLNKKETRIAITFHNAEHVPGGTPNRLEIVLIGEAGMRLNLQTKLGGSEPKFRQLLLSDPLVCIGDCLPEHGLLILEALQGNRRWFLTFKEVETAWKLIDPLQQHLDDPSTLLAIYPAGATRPVQAEEWMKLQGKTWA